MGQEPVLSSYYCNIRQEILALVPMGVGVVVDVGCAAGGLGGALKNRRPGTVVYGVEICEPAAEAAAGVLDAVHLGAAEDGLQPGWDSPDCIVLADVLEHTLDPWTCLATWVECLKPGGCVVISLPNVGHISVLEGVLGGRFDYRDEGILDKTHVRFFARDNILEMVVAAGLRLEVARRTFSYSTAKRRYKTMFGGAVALLDRCSNERDLKRSFLLDLFTSQFVLRCRKDAV